MFSNFIALKKEPLYMGLDTKIVYLLLGSNLGDRKQLIESAIALIGQRVGEIKTRSSFYETAAWGNENQPGFLNLALAVESVLPALDVLELALAIENELGRVRLERWGARLIDIDLIFYHDDIIDIPGKLQLPHPEMHKRKFVMVPMAEIAANVEHPVLKKTVLELLQSMQDNLTVLKV